MIDLGWLILRLQTVGLDWLTLRLYGWFRWVDFEAEANCSRLLDLETAEGWLNL